MEKDGLGKSWRGLKLSLPNQVSKVLEILKIEKEDKLVHEISKVALLISTSLLLIALILSNRKCF